MHIFKNQYNTQHCMNGEADNYGCVSSFFFMIVIFYLYF